MLRDVEGFFFFGFGFGFISMISFGLFKLSIFDLGYCSYISSFRVVARYV